MPYASVKQLPDQVRKNLSAAEQKIFLRAFNRAMQSGDSEQVAFRKAYAAVRKMKGTSKSALECDACERIFVLETAYSNHQEAVHEAARKFSAKERKKAAKQGAAMSDGSFPIKNAQDLRNAIRAIGRAPESKRSAVKAHIKKRARALGLMNLLPDDWK